MIVALPLSSTTTFVPSGNLSLFASSILSFTVFFSSSVSLLASLTSVFSGRFGSTLSAVVLSSDGFSVTRSLAGIVSVDPSAYVIVALPLSSTSTFVPLGKLSLFAFSILSFTVFFSSSVSLLASLTSVFSGRFGSILPAIV